MKRGTAAQTGYKCIHALVTPDIPGPGKRPRATHIRKRERPKPRDRETAGLLSEVSDQARARAMPTGPGGRKACHRPPGQKLTGRDTLETHQGSEYNRQHSQPAGNHLMKAIIALTALIISTTATAQNTNKEDLLIEARLIALYGKEIEKYVIEPCTAAILARADGDETIAILNEVEKRVRQQLRTVNGLDKIIMMIQNRMTATERQTTYSNITTGCQE